MSQPAARRSPSVATSSSNVSPSPTIRPDLVRSGEPLPRAPLVRARQELQRLRVARVGPDAPVEAGDGFGVVIQNLRRLVQDGVEGIPVAAEVRDQHLDGAARVALADRADRGGELRGAAVGQVVAVDRGDDGVRETQLPRGLGDARGLVGVDGSGLALADGAEAAVPRADVAQQHEGGGAFPGPTLMDVGAPRLLAHRHQREPPHHRADLFVFAGRVGADLEPLGPLQARGGGVHRKGCPVLHVPIISRGAGEGTKATSRPKTAAKWGSRRAMSASNGGAVPSTR